MLIAKDSRYKANELAVHLPLDNSPKGINSFAIYFEPIWDENKLEQMDSGDASGIHLALIWWMRVQSWSMAHVGRGTSRAVARDFTSILDSNARLFVDLIYM